jgi:ParB family chromosome partitioning protein
MSPEKPRRLGRGLEALIPGSATERPPIGSELQRIPLAGIHPNPFQPRREFDPTELNELQASLKASGLLQPITVRRKGSGYELVAGERRFRAATGLGWTEIPAIVREYDDRTMLVLALVENLQRANLNAIDEARGYRRLMDEFKLTQQQVADGVGKDRTTITNLLRVLTLPDAVQSLVEHGALTPGHARALLALGPKHSALVAAQEAVSRRMSVRELEQHVRRLSGAPAPVPSARIGSAGSAPNASVSVDPAVRRIEDDLRKYLQTDVKMQVSADSTGKIEMSFYSGEDLDRLLDLILRDARRDF